MLPEADSAVEGSRRARPLVGSVTAIISRAPATAAGAVFLLLSGVVTWRMHGYVVDDAWIFDRYAQNIVAGHGWVFNPGVHNLDAVSSPLYELALTTLTAVVRDVTLAATLLFIATLAGAATMLFVLLRRLGHTLSGLVAGVLLVTNPWLDLTRGMETPLLLLCITGAVYAYVSRHEVALGLLAGAAALSRGDAILLVPLLLGAWTLRDRRFPWRAAAATAVLGAAWILVAEGLGASLAPDTLGAKTAQGESGFWGVGPLFVRGAINMMYTGHLRGWGLTTTLLASAGVLRVALTRRLRSLWPLGATAVLVFVAYGLVVRPPFYHWYLGPELLALTCAAGLGAGWLLEMRPPERRYALVPVGLGVVLAATLLSIKVGPSGPDSRAASYTAAGQWIDRHTPSRATVASLEIGIFGYQTHRTIIDYLGLLSAKSISDLRHHDARSWLARDHPDFILVHVPPAVEERQFMSLAFFHTTYDRVWSGYGVVLYRRVAALVGSA